MKSSKLARKIRYRKPTKGEWRELYKQVTTEDIVAYLAHTGYKVVECDDGVRYATGYDNFFMIPAKGDTTKVIDVPFLIQYLSINLPEFIRRVKRVKEANK